MQIWRRKTVQRQSLLSAVSAAARALWHAAAPHHATHHTACPHCAARWGERRESKYKLTTRTRGGPGNAVTTPAAKLTSPRSSHSPPTHAAQACHTSTRSPWTAQHTINAYPHQKRRYNVWQHSTHIAQSAITCCRAITGHTGQQPSLHTESRFRHVHLEGNIELGKIVNFPQQRHNISQLLSNLHHTRLSLPRDMPSTG